MKFINPILTSFKFIIIGYLALVFSNILYDAFSPDHSVQGRYKIAEHDDELLPLFAPWEFWSKTTPAINFQNEELFILGGISNTNTLYCNEGYGWVKYHSDSFGFRNSHDHFLNETGRVWLIGDSFVHGACVSENETFSGVLQNYGHKAVNLGFGGNGVLMGLAILKEIADVKPGDNVFFFYYEGNDLPAIRAEISDFTKLKRYLIPTFKTGLYTQAQESIDERIRLAILENYQKLEDEEIKFTQKFLKYLTLDSFRNLIFSVDLKAEDCEWVVKDYPDEEFEKLYEIIGEAKRFTVSAGATFYFVYLPSFQSIFADCSFEYKRIVKKLDEIDINTLDARQYFSNLRDKEEVYSFGRHGGHFSPEGYRMIAEKINESINMNQK